MFVISFTRTAVTFGEILTKEVSQIESVNQVHALKSKMTYGKVTVHFYSAEFAHATFSGAIVTNMAEV